MLDYMTLRLIWWVLLGVLLIGFAIMDGFDLGAMMLLPIIARDNEERRIVINTVGPVWEGNQVWIILGAGSIFAAWPYVYAVSFSSLYLAMLAILAGFILRPVSFKYRSKVDNAKWRMIWDGLLCVSGLIPSLLFGVAIGNVLQGIPFHFDHNLRSFYTGSFFELLNPFALLCGLTSVVMLAMHGGFYLSVKTMDKIRERAIVNARCSSLTFIVLFALAGMWVATHIQGYSVQSNIVFDGPSNPLHKTVTREMHAWMNNYIQYPWMVIAPMLSFVGVLSAFFTARLGSGKIAFVSSAIGILGAVSTVGLSMFPFILPSSSNPSDSLLVWDASSSELTLRIMLFATVIFLPIILGYTTWVYWVLRGKVTASTLKENEGSAY